MQIHGTFHSAMKVAFVVHDFDATFGQGRYAMELARRLSSRCDLVVYSNTFNAAGLSGVRWVKVPALRWNVVTTVLTFLPFAERLVRRDRPDVIHAQGLTSWSADLITGHICNAARARSLASQRHRARWFIQLVTPLERAFYRQKRASELIAISECLSTEIKQEYGWNKSIHVLHHGTNTEQFRPPVDHWEREALRKLFRLPEGRWYWLFMGEAVKGLRLVIEQLPQFPEAYLLVVSRSESSSYAALARSIGVEERIRFWGYDPRPELAFRTADAFVYPSDYDPFGMVGSEAMATGLPVILGQTIGAAELVRDGINGLLCDPHQPESLGNQLRRLRDDPELAARLGQAGRETVLETSWDHNAEEVLKIYQQVAARNKGRV
jgi:glycosyltransferase involved in cell wall biosynthesis